ncbi:hypothetical protein CR513_38698, partial [Mucuna pruriens]
MTKLAKKENFSCKNWRSCAWKHMKTPGSTRKSSNIDGGRGGKHFADRTGPPKKHTLKKFPHPFMFICIEDNASIKFGRGGSARLSPPLEAQVESLSAKPRLGPCREPNQRRPIRLLTHSGGSEPQFLASRGEPSPSSMAIVVEDGTTESRPC